MPPHAFRPPPGFRPHGLHLDNASSRLYAVSHSDALHEEAIFVFDVPDAPPADAPLALRLRFLLTSPRFEYHNRSLLWFLNDVAAVDGANELYVTQLGPLDYSPATFQRDKALWRCAWDEAARQPDGRLPAACAPVLPERFLGLNGIAIDPAGNGTLYVNDEFGGPSRASSQLLPFAREPASGRLTPRGPPLGLRGSAIDNVELDHASGDLTMGQYSNQRKTSKDAELLKRAVGKGAFAPATVVRRASLPADVSYQVSSALTYGRWTLLGSPWDLGPYVCG
jgi:hypothetical protein